MLRKTIKSILVLIVGLTLALAQVSAASAADSSASISPAAGNNTSPAAPTHSISPNPPKTVGTDDVAGQYYSFCIWWNGTSALWTNNDPYACEGWLDVYINGKQVAHLQNGGKPLASISCQLTAATGIMTIFTGGLNSGWAVATWLWGSWVGGLGCR